MNSFCTTSNTSTKLRTSFFLDKAKGSSFTKGGTARCGAY